MKTFLCDQMCAELGRWLRTAGYDTEIVNTSLPDLQIFKRAIQEKRFLITRDKYFKELDSEEKIVIYLRGEDLDGWAEQLKEWGINWLLQPFSRCLQCNSLLKKEVPRSNQQLPKDVEEFWCCPICEHFFWLGSHTENMRKKLTEWQNRVVLKIGFGGDLMIGRLVDEFLENASLKHPWGNLLPILNSTDFNLINLETTLTCSEKKVPKVFNFKASPERVSVLSEGNIPIVNIANNHILDFAEEGLLETLQTLDKAQILHIGAGKNLKEAKAACKIEKKGITIGFLGCTDNEPSWKASTVRPGTHFIEVGDVETLRNSIFSLRQKVDLLILSIHWGPNLRKRPSSDFRSFAHELIDLGVDILHGHSAHVFQGVEIYKKKLILYDTGDLVDDYAVDPILRNDQSFFFIVKADKKRIFSVEMIPTSISHFQVNISQESAQIDEMELLCKELKTYPTRKGNALWLYFD